MRKLGRWLLLTVLMCHLWSSVFWPQRYVFPQLFGQSVFSVNTAAPLVALTFDDGPNPHYTPQILDILADYGVKATFFMVGQAIEDYPDIAQQVIQQGHEVGNHTWHHYSLNYLGPGTIYHEIETTDISIRALGYGGPIPFRPPYGHNLLFLPWVLNHMGRANVFWSIDPKDWDAKSPGAILTGVAQQIHNGGIILLHDGDARPRGPVEGSRELTVAATALILKTYLAQGYRFVTLAELLAAADTA